MNDEHDRESNGAGHDMNSGWHWEDDFEDAGPPPNKIVRFFMVILAVCVFIGFKYLTSDLYASTHIHGLLQLEAKSRATFNDMQRYVDSEPPTEAIRQINKFAGEGNINAQSLACRMHFNGIGTHRNNATALQYCYQAANGGHARSQFILGEYFLTRPETGNVAEGIKWHKEAAHQGYARSQNNLADIYYKGVLVEKDMEKVSQWMHLAAQNGNPNSMYFLGHMYFSGEGVKKDWDKAIYWHTKAANEGITDSAYALGVHYSNGEWGDDNPKLAFKWFEKAVKGGDPVAATTIAEIYLNGRIVPKDLAKSVEWLLVAAKMGNNFGEQKLLNFYMNHGYQVAFDPALEWYEARAENNDVQAMRILADLYIRASGVDRDGAVAMSWQKRAAATSGDPQDYFLVARLYAWGTTNLPSNPEQGLLWYKRAVQAGHTEAQYHIARMHYFGQGVPENPVLAMSWLEVLGEDLNADDTFKSEVISKLSDAEIAVAKDISQTCQSSKLQTCAYGI